MRHTCRERNCARGVAYLGGLCETHQPAVRRATAWTRFRRKYPLLRYTWRHGAFELDGSKDLAIHQSIPVELVELGARAYGSL